MENVLYISNYLHTSEKCWPPERHKPGLFLCFWKKLFRSRPWFRLCFTAPLFVTPIASQQSPSLIFHQHIWMLHPPCIACCLCGQISPFYQRAICLLFIELLHGLMSPKHWKAQLQLISFMMLQIRWNCHSVWWENKCSRWKPCRGKILHWLFIHFANRCKNFDVCDTTLSGYDLCDTHFIFSVRCGLLRQREICRQKENNNKWK